MKLQKRLASSILKCSPKRIEFDSANLKDIKEAITKYDMRGLIKKGQVKAKPVKGISKYRARKLKAQKRKGRRKGHGSRKGKASARQNPKKVWMNTVRAQRALLRRLKEKRMITTKDYRTLYRRSKGGFFRSVKHIKNYVKEQNIIKK